MNNTLNISKNVDSNTYRKKSRWDLTLVNTLNDLDKKWAKERKLAYRGFRDYGAPNFYIFILNKPNW